MRLAENEEWMAVNLDKTIQRRENYDNSAALAEGRGRAYALEYCSHEAPTGALRLR
jgi:hypothetical protein